MKFLSPAKLNLNLKVISKRNDGFHDLDTTFQLISLYDEISFEESNKSISINCNNVKIRLEDNLIFKAYDAIKKFSKVDKGLRVNLQKTIPIGAGLGGGSSNAATTLIALNKIWGLGLSKNELISIGKELGADIPFFIHGKNAIAKGVGNIFLDVDFRHKNFLLICPNISVSTKEMFTYINIDELKSNQQNSFLDILLKKHKSIEDFYYEFINEYKLKLSGTGSTLFLEYDRKENLTKILKKIPENWRFFLCEALQYSPLTKV